MAVGEDSLTFDVAESDDYAWVWFATMTQTATAVTASRFPNYYGRVSHKFAPLTAMISSTPVSRAFVCQQSWRDPAVIRQANILLGADRGAAWKNINRSRVALLRAFKEAYEEQS